MIKRGAFQNSLGLPDARNGTIQLAVADEISISIHDDLQGAIIKAESYKVLLKASQLKKYN